MLAYRIGDYQLDPVRRELRCGQELRRLEPQVFDTLLFIVENRARVVSKDDLIAAVWNGRIVSDATVESRIKIARRAIGDDGRSQKIIRTIPRRGFRFIADVEGVDGQTGQVESEETGWSTKSDAQSKPTNLEPVPSSTSSHEDNPTIAVLAFRNLSGDPEREYFADGVVEDIITTLSRIPNFVVIPRTSSYLYKGRSVDVRQLGRELGARYVLDGSIRIAGSRLRISCELIDAASGRHLWADQYDGAMEDVFDLQDKITSSIVATITPKVMSAEIARAQAKPTDSLSTYDLFLRAIAKITPVPTESSINEAAELLHRATMADPQFAVA
jgi:TolB-like protein